MARRQLRTILCDRVSLVECDRISYRLLLRPRAFISSLNAARDSWLYSTPVAIAFGTNSKGRAAASRRALP